MKECVVFFECPPQPPPSVRQHTQRGGGVGGILPGDTKSVLRRVDLKGEVAAPQRLLPPCLAAIIGVQKRQQRKRALTGKQKEAFLKRGLRGSHSPPAAKAQKSQRECDNRAGRAALFQPRPLSPASLAYAHRAAAAPAPASSASQHLAGGGKEYDDGGGVDGRVNKGGGRGSKREVVYVCGGKAGVKKGLGC